METNQKVLWRYGIPAALGATVLLWAVLVGMFLAMRARTGWPDNGSMNALLPLVLIVGLVPIVLTVVDYIAGRRGVIDIKGFKVDFSQSAVQLRGFEMTANIGVPGALVSDSSAMAITNALDAAIENQIVRVDLESGNAWWVTRLLALCAGAVGVGSPSVIVFVGMRDRAPGTFLGWAEPSVIVGALRHATIIRDNKALPQPVTLGAQMLAPNVTATIEYGDLYDKAVLAAKQVPALNFLFTKGVLGINGQIATPVGPAFSITDYDGAGRYATSPDYARQPETAAAQILMDQIGLLRLEHPPDRLTLGRFEELFSQCLYRDAIDLQDSAEKQLATYASAKSRYIALVRDGVYEQIVDAASLARTAIKQLMSIGAA